MRELLTPQIIEQGASLIEQYARTVAAGAKLTAVGDVYETIGKTMERAQLKAIALEAPLSRRNPMEATDA